MSTSQKPAKEWTIAEVADWARKDLHFAEKSVIILVTQEIDGKALLDSPVQILRDLIALFPGIQTVQTKLVWDAIQKSLAEPSATNFAKKRRRNEGTTGCESFDGDYDADDEPAKKRYKETNELRRQFDLTPFHLNLSQNAQKRQVKVVLQTLFVGRDEELKALQTKVKQNLEGLRQRPTTLVISGPSGIGKSHLALKLIQSVKFDWSIAITAVEGSTPNQLLWEELGLSGSSQSNYDIFQLILTSLGDRATASSIAIYFDEVHHFTFSDLRAFRQDIVSFNTANHSKATFQLILTGVSTTFLPLDLGKSAKQPSTGGWYVANLQPLSRFHSRALLHSALEVGNLARAERKDDVIERAIGWFGGNPRLIEFAASSLKSNPNHNTLSLINNVAAYFSSMYSSRLMKKRSLYPIIIAACLSQQPVCYSDELRWKNDDTGTVVKVSSLVRNGIVGFKASSPAEVYGKDSYGHLTLSLLEVRQFVSLNNIYFNVPLLMEPKQQWTWSQLEHFVAEMLSIKLQAFWSLNKETITIADMFPGISMSDDVAKRTISTTSRPYVHTLANRCKTYLDIKNSLGKKMQHAVFINAPNAKSWSVAYVGQKDLELVVHVKHTVKEDGGDNVLASLVRDELSKMPANIPSLFITNRKATDVTSMHETHTNLVLITRENLTSFLGIFSLHRFTVESTEVNLKIANDGCK